MRNHNPEALNEASMRDHKQNKSQQGSFSVQGKQVEQPKTMREKKKQQVVGARQGLVHDGQARHWVPADSLKHFWRKVDVENRHGLCSSSWGSSGISFLQVGLFI